MIFKNKNVVRKIFFIILLIFISIIVFWLGMYAKFYYSMYYGGGVYIDSYVDQTSDSRLWIGLPGMEKYCREEGYEKGDVNCKPIILAVDEAVNTKNNSYIPGLEKYCIEKGMKQYDISCYTWIGEDSEKGIGVKYKQGFLYENEYLYKYDKCIYEKLMIEKVINGYDNIIFYPDYYKFKDMIFRKKDVISGLGCLDSE